MASDNADLQRIADQEYQYGFVTDIDSDQIPPGLNEETVRHISAKKNEPAGYEAAGSKQNAWQSNDLRSKLKEESK